MQRSDFDYDLPSHLIAQHPLEKRCGSRLLVLDGDTDNLQDQTFSELAEFLESGDLLVFNDTRVIPARLFGSKATGGKVEVMIERLQDDNRVLAHVRASKAPKIGGQLWLDDAIEVEVLGRQDGLFELQFHDSRPVLEILEDAGHIPLPPYIERPDNVADHDRYQTVYARRPGAVAAPTAGLHFDDPMLQQLKAKGVNFAFVTLHVGAGTFQPVRVDDLDDHHMHAEYVEVSQEVCDKVNETHQHGGRVVAVGTTSVRSLEAAAQDGHLKPFSGETRLFITPGYKFKVIDLLVTNFHLPESTLLMLVSAFGGYLQIKRAYAHAIEQGYRFFSYGDAMFIKPESAALMARE